MDEINELDITRLNGLLHRTSDFISYFELVDSKMVEWRQNLEHTAATQQQQAQAQLQALQQEVIALQNMLSEAGLLTIRNATENKLKQEKNYLMSIQKMEQQLLRQMNHHQRELSSLAQQALVRISQQGSKTIDYAKEQLAQYDAQQFQHLAQASCRQIDSATQHTHIKSNRLLRKFQWRTLGMTLLTTLLTTFTLSLYLSDEYPWEIHRHAINERNAGKMLLNIWPTLSQQEQEKILNIKNAVEWP